MMEFINKIIFTIKKRKKKCFHFAPVIISVSRPILAKWQHPVPGTTGKAVSKQTPPYGPEQQATDYAPQVSETFVTQESTRGWGSKLSVLREQPPLNRLRYTHMP